MTRLAGLLALLFALTFAGGASAHLLPAKEGTVHIAGRHAYVVLSVPASALSGYDDNHDGLIGPGEIARHEASLKRQVNQGFTLSDAHARTLDSGNLLFPGNTGESRSIPSDHMVVLHGQLFSGEPRALTMTDTLFGKHAELINIHASRDRADGGKDVELAVLRPGASSFRLFESPLQTAGQFIGVGINHILTGLDHLLFLLTIVAAGVSVRHWFAVVSTFTVAHSITLTMAVLGLVHVSPAIVEPAIAASIVAMSLYNLFGTGKAQTLLWRVGTVFACGLLHGLGFASSLGDAGVDRTHLVPTLFGFNLGIEIGQGLFIVGVLAAMFLIRHAPVEVSDRRFTQVASAVAGTIGAGMIWVRVAGIL